MLVIIQLPTQYLHICSRQGYSGKIHEDFLVVDYCGIGDVETVDESLLCQSGPGLIPNLLSVCCNKVVDRSTVDHDVGNGPGAMPHLPPILRGWEVILNNTIYSGY